jgi:hypothetical protein
MIRSKAQTRHQVPEQSRALWMSRNFVILPFNFV